jgi:hypothetical protein
MLVYACQWCRLVGVDSLCSDLRWEEVCYLSLTGFLSRCRANGFKYATTASVHPLADSPCENVPSCPSTLVQLTRVVKETNEQKGRKPLGHPSD